MISTISIATNQATMPEVSEQICEILHSIYVACYQSRLEYDYSTLHVSESVYKHWVTPYGSDTQLDIIQYSLEDTATLLPKNSILYLSLLKINHIISLMRNMGLETLSQIVESDNGNYYYTELVYLMRATLKLVV
jgi:hypothetical protein